MISSNQRRIAAARSLAVFARQPGKACCAASIARCASGAFAIRHLGDLDAVGRIEHCEARARRCRRPLARQCRHRSSATHRRPMMATPLSATCESPASNCQVPRILPSTAKLGGTVKFDQLPAALQAWLRTMQERNFARDAVLQALVDAKYDAHYAGIVVDAPGASRRRRLSRNRRVAVATPEMPRCSPSPPRGAVAAVARHSARNWPRCRTVSKRPIAPSRCCS